jgi:short-subunit dehydrogenase
VNNAGFGQPGAMEDLSRGAMRYQFEVNVFGLQELANLCLPVMRRQGWGRIVNVSSVLGRMPLPYVGIYCASKYAVEAMSDTLRIELRGTGIAVAIVEPGPIDTAFRIASMAMGRANLGSLTATAHEDYYRRQDEAHAQGRKKPSQAFTAPPEAVAKKILHALQSSRPRRRYPVTFPAHLGLWLSRFAPAALLDRLLSSDKIR